MTISDFCEILIFALLGLMIVAIGYLIVINVIDSIRAEIASLRAIRAYEATLSLPRS